MSDNNYTNDILKSLDLFSVSGDFIPMPYPDTDSCFKYVKDSNGITTKYVNIVSTSSPKSCPHCGCLNRHESKGVRKIFLTHKSNGDTKTLLEVSYRRYLCKDCGRYFKEEIPFKFPNKMLTVTAAQLCLLGFRENTAMAVLARMQGISKSTVYRLFNKHIEINHRFYHLSSVISIDELSYQR